jgi:hypothetical protein
MANASPDLLAQVAALNQAFMQARGGGEDFRTRMPDLSPEMVAFLSSLQGERDSAGNGLLRSFIDPASGANFHQYGNYATIGQGDSQSMNTDPAMVNWSQSPFQFGVNSDTSNYLANYDPQGHFTGYEMAADNNNWRDFITAMVMMAPAVAGVYGAAAGGTGETGAAAGAAGGTGATDWASWAANEGSGALAGSGYTGAAFNAGELAAGAGTAAGTGAGTDWANWAANEGSNALSGSGYTGSAFNAGEAAAAGSAGMNAAQKLAAEQAAQKAMQQGGSNAGTNAATNAATKGLMDYFTKDGALDYAKIGAGLLGAYTGYQDGKDKQDTQTRDPWKPAQPYLEGLLREGAGLYDQYKQQPFSPAQQVGYGNFGNVLDYINGNAGGLLDGFQAMANGQNQFVRGQPKKLIGASYDANNPQVPWLPQKYGNFGTGK